MRILFTTDGSPTSEHALVEACKLLPLTGAEALVVGVVEPPTYTMGYDGFAPAVATALSLEPRRLEAELEKARALLAERGLTAATEQLAGDPAEAILERACAYAPDVVVMGSHGRNAVGRLLLGSVSDAVLHHWDGPVLIVRDRA